MTDDPARPLREVLGEGVRRIREAAGARQDDVSRVAQAHGLSWSRSKVAALERGEKPISMEEYALLPRILAEATRQTVTRAELIAAGARITITPAMTMSGRELARAYADEMTRPDVQAGVIGARPWRPLIGEAEQKAAARLGIDPPTVEAVAWELWGRSLADERDRVVRERAPDAAPDRRRALRGQVTRQLVEQIAAKVAQTEKAVSSGQRGEARQSDQGRPE